MFMKLRVKWMELEEKREEFGDKKTNIISALSSHHYRRFLLQQGETNTERSDQTLCRE